MLIHVGIYHFILYQISIVMIMLHNQRKPQWHNKHVLLRCWQWSARQLFSSLAWFAQLSGGRLAVS